ncbi:MAG: ATP phosphoribosyltransferase regulatory subunit [Chloroflexi bacterium]|nr:ATP phosphoribosyltransferase regulatory subunit [Chloroflexota bacterium]
MTSQYEPVRRLPNMQDAGPGELAARDRAISTLREIFGLRGYDRAETPILEQTELYLRKSGGALSSRLYDFSEPGGYDVSLRPEFTSAVLRLAADRGVDNGTLRLMYDGPVFRYAGPEDEDGSKTRQFTQLGAELIGPRAPAADGEVIAMALEGLHGLGITNARVVVGHVGVVLAALSEFKLSERAKLFLVSNIGELKRGQVDAVSEKAAVLGFITDAVIDDAQVAADRERLASTIERVMTEGIGVPLGQNTGSRTPEEIIARLARKLSQADNPEDFKRALEMLSRLSQVSGQVAETLDAGSELLSSAGVPAGLISDLREVLGAAEAEGVSRDQITVDFGLVRGLAYYTGMLFDIYAGDATEETLGGGGRYDGLTRALGYDRDVPALGFAYNLDAIVETRTRELDPTSDLALISPAESGSVGSAIQRARELRTSGIRAAIDFENSGPSESGSSRTSAVSVEGQGER